MDYCESNDIGIQAVYSQTPSWQSIHIICDRLFGITPSTEHVTAGEKRIFDNGFVKI